MIFYVYVISGFTIFIAGVIGLIRFHNIYKAYHPLLYFFWLAGLNEALNYILIINQRNTIINNNIYVLFEAILITWYFNRKGLFKKWTPLFYCLLTAFGMAWALENFVFSSIQKVSLYFRVLYSFVIVLTSIHCINDIIT